MAASDGKTARIETRTTASGGLECRLAGRLDADGAAEVWTAALAAASGASGAVLVDASGLDYVDTAGLGLILALRAAVEGAGRGFDLRGLDERFARLMERLDPAALERRMERQERRSLAECVGRNVVEALAAGRELVAYTGECVAVLASCLRNPRLLRRKDLWLSCIRVGVDSLPIVLLIGFLIGLILSFQSAMSLQRFAAEVFVPNMLGLAMFREMGPLVTAILLASRSGSAFAAEIGTMKVNEEVDALTTMGISPLRFLVAPKIAASLLTAPFVSLFFSFAALVGGAVVMLLLGYPLATFTSRVFANTHFNDVFGGLFKILFFSLLVAGIGCQRGLTTGTGAGAVGRSTTAAVVSGLVLIALADGAFAVVYYALGI
ncbi:MAG: ABC transporter permease [Desulfovibrionaceae bacterium]